jgi:hypothetical protein
MDVIAQPPIYWGFDAEFLPTGTAGDPASVHSVQFSDGAADNTFIETAEDLKKFLHNRSKTLKEVYGFNFLCDMGSVKEWLPRGAVEVVPYRGRLVGKIHYGSARIKAYDTMPLLKNFGKRRLADVGDVVGVPKLPKPDFLGIRKWETPREHEAFEAYAVADAVITARAAKWLIEANACDPRKHASAGSLAADYFQFPKRHRRVKGRVMMPPIERALSQSVFAGRSEMFTTGYTPCAVYNDVKSLYPCSIFATRALTIDGVKPCEPDEITISSDLNDKNYGWVVGCFETKNRMWGLPIRAKQVTYVVGKVTGMFHTFDIAAAKATPLWIAKAYRPTFDPKRATIQNRFDQMLLDRVEGRLNEREARYAKAVLNSTYGKLGQSHPEAPTTNYPAFTTILAHSHLIMSTLFDKSPTPILGMDTDSIFSATDMTGKYGNLTDGELSLPIIMEVKGKGELVSFRAKTYMMHEEGKPIRVYGRHAWHYFIEDYFKLWQNPDLPFKTRISVKHTLKTRIKRALKLPLGFWDEKPVELTRDKVRELLKADLKRARRTYDSFALFEQRKSQQSEPYVLDEILLDPTFWYPPKSHEKFPYITLNRFSTSSMKARSFLNDL